MMTGTYTNRGSIWWLLAVALLPLLAMVAHGQESTITADPNAQQLRLIWKVTGKPFVGGDKVGAGAGGLGDIYGTGKGAWAVLVGSKDEWRIYRNDSDDIAKDTVPVQTFGGYGPIPSYPVVGDFWGTGHNAIGFARRDIEFVGQYRKYYYELHLFRTEGDTIADSESAILKTRSMTPARQVAEPSGVLAVDLDGDGADELILVHGGVGYDTGVSNYPEIWIYKGGPDFQLDSPTVIVKHPIRNGSVGVFAATGDFDGDGHVDIVMTRANGDERDHLTFYWGTEDIDEFGRTENSRIIPLVGPYPTATLDFVALDCDGDGTTDLAISGTNSGQAGTYLYRSGTKKNMRTRSYQLDDADLLFPKLLLPLPGGFLNDSTRRVAMLAFGPVEGSPSGQPPLLLFSGGTDGPDLAYDTYNTVALGHLPVYDADGDGWDDYMGADYTVDFQGGIAVLYAGGPYIPRDSTSGVEDIVVTGIRNAISVWPNPVRDELHVAWRGDLTHMPSRFRVHDMLGRTVASGDVDSWRGAALWHCENISTGIYILSIYDRSGSLIATTRIIKQ